MLEQFLMNYELMSPFTDMRQQASAIREFMQTEYSYVTCQEDGMSVKHIDPALDTEETA